MSLPRIKTNIIPFCSYIFTFLLLPFFLLKILLPLAISITSYKKADFTLYKPQYCMVKRE